MMKYNKFPDGYKLEAQIIYQDKFLCFLRKDNNKQGTTYSCKFFDPFEDKIFGHECKCKPANQVLNREPFSFFATNSRNTWNPFQLHLGLNPETPLLVKVNCLPVFGAESPYIARCW